MTRENIKDLMRALTDLKMNGAESNLELAALDAAVAALRQIEDRMKATAA